MTALFAVMHVSSAGPSRHAAALNNLVAVGAIAGMAGLAAGSTRSRMTVAEVSPASK
jgi:hypothetical protein